MHYLGYYITATKYYSLAFHDLITMTSSLVVPGYSAIDQSQMILKWFKWISIPMKHIKISLFIKMYSFTIVHGLKMVINIENGCADIYTWNQIT